MTKSTRHDVAIVGGGMVGQLTAALLAPTGLDIAVLEANAEKPTAAEGMFDNRVSAITRASQNLLTAAGAWQYLDGSRFIPYHQMHVWDANSNGEIHFNCADIGEPDLGAIIENRNILLSLDRAASAYDNITWYRSARINRIREEGQQVTVELADAELSCALLIGADGAHSRVRELTSMGLTQKPYDHTALVTTIKLEKGHQATAWQCFLTDGPLAVLPLPGDLASIVWSASEKTIEHLMTLPAASFCRELEQALEYRLGAVEMMTERATYPLIARHAQQYVKPGIALVGDAAHTIHPLAGQGVNLGFLDAASLVEIIEKAMAAGRQPGSIHVLRKYERWRKGQNHLMQQSMMGFKTLFTQQHMAVRLIRGIGINLVDRLFPVKSSIIRRAMGLEGDLPLRAYP